MGNKTLASFLHCYRNVLGPGKAGIAQRNVAKTESNGARSQIIVCFFLADYLVDN